MCERMVLNFEFLCGEDRNVCASKEMGVLLERAVLGWMTRSREPLFRDVSRVWP